MKCVPGCLFCLSQELTPPLCFGKFFLIFVQQYCQRRGSPFFLPFFSLPFPHPFPPLASTVSSPTVLLPSTQKILELSVLGKNGPFCSFFHSQIKYHDCTVFFLNCGLCYYPLHVASGNTTILHSRASQQSFLFLFKAPVYFFTFYFSWYVSYEWGLLL